MDSFVDDVRGLNCLHFYWPESEDKFQHFTILADAYIFTIYIFGRNYEILDLF